MGIPTKLNSVKEVNHQLIRKEKAGLGLRQSFFWSESEANFFLVWVWCKVFFWFGLRQRFFWSDTREVPVQLKLLRWAVSKKERRNNEQGAVPVLTLSSTSWPYNWLTHSLNWETAWHLPHHLRQRFFPFCSNISPSSKVHKLLPICPQVDMIEPILYFLVKTGRFLPKSTKSLSIRQRDLVHPDLGSSRTALATTNPLKTNQSSEKRGGM